MSDSVREPPQRERLPHTRESITHKFNISGHEGYITAGFYEDGRPGEIFLKMGKEGSTLGGLLDAVGILSSIAFQHGVPLRAIAHKLEHTRFEPSGFTKDKHIKEASSIVDYVFRWLTHLFEVSDEDALSEATSPQLAKVEAS